MMEPSIQRGYLVLADLSGYTSYLAGTELPHAQAVLVRITNLILAHLKSRLCIAEVEGDAVFAYADAARLQRGETLLELIESTYVAFRDEQRSMHRMATCACKACEAISTLDLKFVAHFGEYALHDYGGWRKPVGSSVNIAHRLLKNTVGEATGWRGYALFTEECLHRMDIWPAGMHTSIETYEHLGNVATQSVNLDLRYRQLTDERRIFLEAEDADLVCVCDLPAPAPLVWEWLNDPHKRATWWEKAAWHPLEQPEGRTLPGAINHCSNSKFNEYILDWRPFSDFTVERKRGPLSMTVSTRLTPSDEGTRLYWHMRLNGSLPRPVLRSLCRHVLARVLELERCKANLKRCLAAACDPDAADVQAPLTHLAMTPP